MGCAPGQPTNPAGAGWLTLPTISGTDYRTDGPRIRRFMDSFAGLLLPLVSSGSLKVIATSDGSVAGSGWFTKITEISAGGSTVTAVAREFFVVTTAGSPPTVKLPASPTAIDLVGAWGQNQGFNIDPNGKTIKGSSTVQSYASGVVKIFMYTGINNDWVDLI